MPISEQIAKQLTDAMRAKDTARLLVLRNLKAAFSNELVALKRAPTGTLTDDEARAVLRRLAKQRRDSILQFRNGGREELARAEEAELNIIESYLPAPMSEDSMRKIAAVKQKELGITDKSNANALMSALMKELKGKADGAAVKKVVNELFK